MSCGKPMAAVHLADPFRARALTHRAEELARTLRQLLPGRGRVGKLGGQRQRVEERRRGQVRDREAVAYQVVLVAELLLERVECLDAPLAAAHRGFFVD